MMIFNSIFNIIFFIFFSVSLGDIWSLIKGGLRTRADAFCDVSAALKVITDVISLITTLTIFSFVFYCLYFIY